MSVCPYLRISKGGLDLVNIPANERVMLIGRSPQCSGVLRVRGIGNVAFVVRWEGDGEVNEGAGYFTVTAIQDIAADVIARRDWKQLPPGTPLTQPVDINGFHLSLEESWLETRDFEAPIYQQLKDDTNLTVNSLRPTGDQSACFEIVIFHRKSNVVTMIEHQPRSKRPSKIRCTNWIKLERMTEEQATVMLTHPSHSEVLINGQAVISNKFMRCELGRTDLLVVQTPEIAMLARIVAEEGKTIPRDPGPWQDTFARNMTGSVLAGFLLLSSIGSVKALKRAIKIEPPKRVVSLELKTYTPVAKVQVAPTPNRVPSQVPMPEPTKKAAPAKAATKTTVKKDNRAGLNHRNQGAEDAAGLLNTLQANKSGTRVRSDMLIDQGIINRKVSGENGDFFVAQPAMGKVDNSAYIPENKGLESAQSTVSSNEVFEKKSRAPIVRKNSRSELGLGQAAGLGGALPTSAPSMGMVLSGGLTREQVLGALDEYRGQIKSCYDAVLGTSSRVRGRVVYEWTITPVGKVTGLRITSSQAKAPALESCVKDVLKGITYPQAASGQPTVVSYPFIFKKAN